MYRQAAYAVCCAAMLTACETSGTAPATGAPARAAPEARTPSPPESTRPEPPAGGTTAPAGTGATEGPHEGTRGSVPPGKTRDGLPPQGGAIIDPEGVVTRHPTPPGMR
jgi:hypothetical protein